MIKTYQLINDINLTTPVLCDGKARMISFTGGMKNSGETIRHGSFTTSDGKMQKALEKDSGFGSVFRCITPVPVETVVVPDESAGNVPATTGSDSAGNAGDGAGSDVDHANEGNDGNNGANASEGESAGNDGHSTGLTQVPGITNKQGAIEWLAANKGINDLKPTCRVEAVRNAATLSGVEFPDWK